jgi:hypothetical protein
MPRTTRSKRTYESSVSTPPPKRRLRRDGGPYCTDFGRYRKDWWRGKGYFFCSPCDLYENEHSSNKRIKRDSNKFRCKAKHTSFAYPTDLLKNGGLYVPSKNPAARKTVDNSIDGDSEDEGDDESSAEGEGDNTVLASSLAAKKTVENSIDGDSEDEEDDKSSAEGEGDGTALAASEASVRERRDHAKREEIVSTLKKKVEDLNKRNHAQRQELCSLRKKVKEMTQANTTLPVPGSSTKKIRNTAFKNSIGELLEEFYGRWFPKWGRKRKGRLLAEAFWGLMDGVAQDRLMTLAKNQLRKTIYHPFNILRAMDFAGGTLSYEGIEVLRQCETAGNTYVRGTVIPCSAELKRVAAMVETFGNQVCPYELATTEDGEMFTFDSEKTIPMIVG